MDKCIQCGKRITPSDSSAEGVCVDCQEYNYYHGGNETIKPVENGYTCVCGKPASFYNSKTDKLYCEECN